MQSCTIFFLALCCALALSPTLSFLRCIFLHALHSLIHSRIQIQKCFETLYFTHTQITSEHFFGVCVCVHAYAFVCFSAYISTLYFDHDSYAYRPKIRGLHFERDGLSVCTSVLALSHNVLFCVEPLCRNVLMDFCHVCVGTMCVLCVFVSHLFCSYTPYATLTFAHTLSHSLSIFTFL